MYKLGAKPKREDSRTIKLKAYLNKDQALPNIPDVFDWSKDTQGNQIIDYPMYGNDTYSNCVPVGLAHAIQTFTKNTNKYYEPTLQEVLDFYTKVTGFNPDIPSTDNGTVILDANKEWKNNGLGGHKVDMFVEVDPQDLDELRVAAYLFGGLITGTRLPKNCIQQFDHNGPFEITKDGLEGDGTPGSLGGHCMYVSGFNNANNNDVTWAKSVMSRSDWFSAYTEEVWAYISFDWLKQNNITPSGVNLNQMYADIKLISNGITE